MAEEVKAPAKPAKKKPSPGVLALRKVVDDVYAEAREAKKRGEPVGWSSSKFPCELAAAFDLKVVYPENQAAGIAANRNGEMLCQAAEDLGYDNDICGYARISLAYSAGYRVGRKFTTTITWAPPLRTSTTSGLFRTDRRKRCVSTL